MARRRLVIFFHYFLRMLARRASSPVQHAYNKRALLPPMNAVWLPQHIQSCGSNNDTMAFRLKEHPLRTLLYASPAPPLPKLQPPVSSDVTLPKLHSRDVAFITPMALTCKSQEVTMQSHWCVAYSELHGITAAAKLQPGQRNVATLFSLDSMFHEPHYMNLKKPCAVPEEAGRRLLREYRATSATPTRVLRSMIPFESPFRCAKSLEAVTKAGDQVLSLYFITLTHNEDTYVSLSNFPMLNDNPLVLNDSWADMM